MIRDRLSRMVQASLAGRRAWVVIAILCGLFAILGVLTRYSFLQGLDLHFTLELQEEAGFPWDPIMHAATFLGNGGTLTALALLTASILFAIHLRRGALLAIVSLAGLPIDWALKQIWERARPDAALVHVTVNRVGYSFPSGHALGSTMFYGSLAALAWIHMPKGLARDVVTVALACVPPAVAISRVYLGAHWLSDVVAGTAVGLALLIPMIKLYARYAATEERKALDHEM